LMETKFDVIEPMSIRGERGQYYRVYFDRLGARPPST
jgi:hypothetical protein